MEMVEKVRMVVVSHVVRGGRVCTPSAATSIVHGRQGRITFGSVLHLANYCQVSFLLSSASQRRIYEVYRASPTRRRRRQCIADVTIVVGR